MSNLEKNLSETRNILEKEIACLNFDEFNYKSDTNSWSVAQVCHHLVLVEHATIRAIDWGLKNRNSRNQEQKNIRTIADRAKKIKAPSIVEPNQGPFEVQQIIDLLSNSRKSLMAFLRTIDNRALLKEKSVKHPAFEGELPLDQWLELIPLHEKRHIEQIRKIKSAIGVED